MNRNSFFLGMGKLGIIFTTFLLFIIGLIVIIGLYYSFQTRGDKVGVVEIKGLIRDSRGINSQIIALRDREDIKAIVLRIDSPGGGVGPSQEIYNEIKKVKKANKIVVASMGSVAASGGYYIASAADKIVANPGTITGSIGVIMEFANIQELLFRLGMKGVVIKSGEFKDTGSPLREMKAEEKRLLQELVDDIHRQFIEVVAENRGMDIKMIQKIADGRIFSGAQAKDAKLVDELGNLQDAIEIASSLAGIEGKPKVIYLERKRATILDIIFGKGVNRFLEGFDYFDYSPKFLLYIPK